MNRYTLLCFSLLIAGAVASCGTPPQERFFTLASDPAPVLSARTADTAMSILVGPVTVPDLVDRPQFVVRAAANRVEIAEQARWAAPLKTEIPRVIADHLGRLIPGSSAMTSSSRGMTAPDYRVVIDIQRFDSAPGDGATIEAAWMVRAREGASLGGRSLVREPSAGSYDELVLAHSRALSVVSRDIADAIGSLRPRSAGRPQ